MLPAVFCDISKLLQILLAVLNSAIQDYAENLLASIVCFLQLARGFDDVFLNLHLLRDEVSELLNVFLMHLFTANGMLVW